MTTRRDVLLRISADNSGGREGFTPLCMLMIYWALINFLNIGTHKNTDKANVRLHRWRLPMTRSHGFFATTLPFSHT
jgi:hypothetical protein